MKFTHLTVYSQVFARKLVRCFPGSDVQNEIRAVTKLCAPRSHKHIVEVFRHGTLPNSPYYFFDMELCAFNLKEHAVEMWSSFFADWSAGLWYIWGIMGQIAAGVSFIQEKLEVHRDLKPNNGIQHIRKPY